MSIIDGVRDYFRRKKQAQEERERQRVMDKYDPGSVYVPFISPTFDGGSSCSDAGSADAGGCCDAGGACH